MELTLSRKPKAADTGPFSPSQPRVNLVPRAALDRAANARARKFAIIGWVGSVAAIGLWWGAGFVEANRTADALAAAAGQGEQLALKMALYAPVTTIATQTQSLTDTVASQTAGEVDHGDVINRFLAAIGDTMTVSSLQIGTTNDAGCVSTDPFNQVPLAGCVTFTGTSAGGAPAASEVITSLTKDSWFVDAFIPTVGADSAGGTPMSGTVGLTVDAFTAPTEPEAGN